MVNEKLYKLNKKFYKTLIWFCSNILNNISLVYIPSYIIYLSLIILIKFI
jgi:hypothetical protein